MKYKFYFAQASPCNEGTPAYNRTCISDLLLNFTSWRSGRRLQTGDGRELNLASTRWVFRISAGFTDFAGVEGKTSMHHVKTDTETRDKVEGGWGADKVIEMLQTAARDRLLMTADVRHHLQVPRDT